MTWSDELARILQAQQAQREPQYFFLSSSAPSHITNTISPKEKLAQLKHSIKEIEAEPLTNARKNIEGKIERLVSVGALQQAIVLERELKTKEKLNRLKEWDYRVLTREVISDFEREHAMTLRADGLKIHIDNLEIYTGNPESGKEKDRIIPDKVLEKLEVAQERKLFDSFAVLWAEKVTDPLLLGCVDGCCDYFFIAEWGEDITFEQIVKGENHGKAKS